MWKYFIELFLERSYGEYVEGAEVPGDGIPTCVDLNVAKCFDTPNELVEWVNENTSLKVENGEYGIKGVYFPHYDRTGCW